MPILFLLDASGTNKKVAQTTDMQYTSKEDIRTKMEVEDVHNIEKL